MNPLNSLPRAGLIRLTAEWFDTVVASPELVKNVREDGETIQRFLSSVMDLAGSWQVNSALALDSCCRELRALDFDLVVLVYQVWAEDYYLNDLVQAIGNCPLLVWCYQPWRKPPPWASFVEVLRASGPVGTLEGLGTIRNLGKEYLFAYGAPGEERLRLEIKRIANAAQIRRQLRSARFGLLPGRNEQMQSTFVDEFRLRSEIGPQVELLAVDALKESMDRLDAGEINDFVIQLREEYPIHGVDDLTLETAARASLGLAHLGVSRGLDLISLNDIAPELHNTLGLRPCLYPDLFRQKKIQVGLEGDLGAAVARFILEKLAGPPLLFCEFWYWDEEENAIVGGHAGIQDPQAANPGRVTISKDYEFDQSDRLSGAHYQFVARPGRVTLLQMRCTPNDWQVIVTCGEALACAPWLAGYPHAVIRLDAPVGHFLQRVAQVGSTQHWIMAYGDLIQDVEPLFQILNVSVLKI